MRLIDKGVLSFMMLCAIVSTDVLSAQGLAPPSKSADRWTIIHAGTLLIEAGKPSRPNQSIVVKNDKIEAIRDGFVGPEYVTGVDAATIRVIDLKNEFVMPGLMDAHVHIGGRSGFADAITNARSKLMGGATTVRDASSDPTVIFPLRDSINKNHIVGPRILAAGSALSTTGGHGDSRNGDFASSLRDLPSHVAVCDGLDSCTKAVRTQILLGADQIKIMASAGVGDNSDTGLDQQFTTNELEKIVEVSHLMKRKVMAHAIGNGGIKAAVRAGVDSIEHADFLDDESARMMKQHGTYLVATLNAPADVLRRIRDPRPGDRPVSENTRNKMLSLPAAQPSKFGGQIAVALRNGVKMAVGSDFGGVIGEELVLLVQAGMSAEDALRAATVGNADLFGITTIAGTLEPGKSADIIGLRGDPRADIRMAVNPPFVMARGHQAKGPGFQQP